MALLATSSIIGIIVAIALVATTIAVCLYLYAQKNKAFSAEASVSENATSEEPLEEEKEDAPLE